MSDQLIRFVTRNGYFRALGVETTTLCETARRLHDTDPTATVALARVATGTALLGGLLKGNQRLALAIEANGPLQKLHAETDAVGHLRCSVKNPVAGLPPLDDRFDVANAVGKAGFLQVIKDLGLKEPYRGMVQLQTSEIGDDIAYYLTTSEQVPSSVALGVQLGQQAEIKTAGGLIIQALPGCDNEAILQTEGRLKSLGPISKLLADGQTPTGILQQLFTGFECSPPEKIPIVFRCTCNRKQIAAILRNLGRDETAELTARKEEINVTCEYCRQGYSFSPEEVAALNG
jgi:molecular chaperone Hsp33